MERWWLDLIGWLVCPGHQPEIGWVDKMSWGGQLKKGKLKKKKKKPENGGGYFGWGLSNQAPN